MPSVCRTSEFGWGAGRQRRRAGTERNAPSSDASPASAAAWAALRLRARGLLGEALRACMMWSGQGRRGRSGRQRCSGRRHPARRAGAAAANSKWQRPHLGLLLLVRLLLLVIQPAARGGGAPSEAARRRQLGGASRAAAAGDRCSILPGLRVRHRRSLAPASASHHRGRQSLQRLRPPGCLQKRSGCLGSRVKCAMGEPAPPVISSWRRPAGAAGCR